VAVPSVEVVTLPNVTIVVVEQASPMVEMEAVISALAGDLVGAAMDTHPALRAIPAMVVVEVVATPVVEVETKTSKELEAVASATIRSQLSSISKKAIMWALQKMAMRKFR